MYWILLVFDYVFFSSLQHSLHSLFWVSERVWDSAHVHLQQAVWRHKDFSDSRRSHAPIYRPGDQVWLSTWYLHLRLPCRKPCPRFIGPFTIERQINEVTFLQLPARNCIHHAFHVSLLKPFSPSVPGTKEPAVSPPPEVQEKPSIYLVRKILDFRRWAGHLEYLIDWEVYGPEERSWGARDDVLDHSLLTDFHHPEAVAGPVAVVGRQEPPLQEGVLSGSHSHFSHHQLHTPDPTHLITDHQSSRALYQRTPPEQSLSGLEHSMLTHLTLLPFVYSLVIPVFRSQISTAPVLHRL